MGKMWYSVLIMILSSFDMSDGKIGGILLIFSSIGEKAINLY